jgi:hypothetical protein
MPIPLGVLAVAGAGAAGGGGSFDLLETTVLGSDTASVTFSSLGSYSAYKHLQIRMTAATTAYPGFAIRFNSDTGSNYAYHRLSANGSTVVSGASTSAAEIRFVNALPDEARDNSNIFGAAIVEILDFSNSSKNSTVRGMSGSHYTDAKQIGLYSGLWNNTNAVTSITLLDPSSGNFVSGSRFSLYGIK